MEISELLDLERVAAVEQNVSVWRLHNAPVHFLDQRIVKPMPRLQHRVVAQSRVVTHVQVTSVDLEKENGSFVVLLNFLILFCFPYVVSKPTSNLCSIN